MKKVRNSQAVSINISINSYTEMSKTQFFDVNVVNTTVKQCQLPAFVNNVFSLLSWHSQD